MEPWVTELTPLSFVERSADVFPDKVAVVYGDTTLTYREFAAAVQHRARSLRAAGIQPGDRVAYLMPNVPEMLVATFAVPLAGAVLVAINTRLAAEEVRYICDHSQAKLLVVDSALTATVAPVAADLATVSSIAVAGPDVPIPGAVRLSDLPADFPELPWSVADEHSTISINYTSGTTGRPKGVMYTHRGAYLNALGEVYHSRHNENSVYLWTLPMFHCNGWCTAWALVAAGGTQVCLREVRGDVIWRLVDDHGVTHLNGAPTVITTIMNAPEAHPLDHPLVVTTAGAPPSPTMIQQASRMGFSLVHVYGLTETYGPYSVCQWQTRWDTADQETRARLQARQGVGMIQAERVRVVQVSPGNSANAAVGVGDLADRDLAKSGLVNAGAADGGLVDVPADGETMGEIVMRGNNVMKGYYRDPPATAKAFAGGWFHSGDLDE